MARVKQFADDLGISKNKAQALINKGRSRKDGGSQILENVMKPKGYKPGGSVTKTKTNPKAPIAKVTKEKLKKIVTIKVDKPSKKPSKKLTQKQKIAEAIEAGTLQVGDVNEMTEEDMKQFLKAKGKRFGGKVKKMKLGGEAKPLVGNQFKLDKNKNGRIDGGDFAKMEMGGKVKEYGGGGKVKGGKMTCRGMGAAIKGGGFSIS